MRKSLVVLSAVALLFAANLSANAPAAANRFDPGKAIGRQAIVPPILSQAGPRVPVTARVGKPAPAKITPVVKGPGERFSPTAQDWAEYMHDSSRTCMIDGNAASFLTPQWTYVTPGGGQTAFCGSPVESDGIICFTSSDGYLYAINRATGATAWAPVLLGASGYRGGTPVIWQDRVVTEMVNGTGTTSAVFCRSMATGDSLWTTPIPATPGLWNVYLSRPVVLTINDTGYVFVPCWTGSGAPYTARIVGINMTTGAMVYDQQWAGNRFVGGLACDGTNIYAPLLTTGVVKLHPGTGPGFDSIWVQQPGPGMTEPYGVYSTPVYCNGQVFAAKGYISGGESLYAMDAGTGVVNWCILVGSATLGIDVGSPAVDSSHVYMYASDFSASPYYSQVMSYNQNDGSPAWSNYYRTTDGLFDGAPAVTAGVNKRLYLATGFGSTYGHLLTLDATSGSLLQDLPYATDFLYNSICRPYGGLYTLTYGSYASGTLVGYRLNDGPPSPADVGVSAITVPRGRFSPGIPITPQCVVRNYGTLPQSDIPVTCRIDSAGTPVYTGSGTIAGPLNPGDTGSVSFSPDWTPDGSPSYFVKMFTALSGDTCPENDSASLTTWEGWSRITPCPYSPDRVAHAVVYDPVHDMFYMVGGCPEGLQGTYVARYYRYSPAANTWTARPGMPKPLGWEPGVYCRGIVYYLGGHNDSGAVVTTNYRYSIATNYWSTGTAVPRRRIADMEVAWRDSLIYCLGGWDDSSAYDDSTVDIYNPITNAWYSGTPLPYGADMGGAAIIGDTIYIVDAINRSTGLPWTNLYKGCIDPANPTSITWIQGPSFGSNATCITGAAALGTRVYWFGGMVGATTPSNAGWYYDQATGQISSFVTYMGTICRNQWICARANAPQGDSNGLYGFAGDSACNWSAPNRGYYKLTIPTLSVGISDERAGKDLTTTDFLDAVGPNPLTGRAVLHYSLSKAGTVSLKLYDITGKCVRTVYRGSAEAGSHEATVDVSRLARGIYVVKLATDDYSATSKLVIE